MCLEKFPLSIVNKYRVQIVSSPSEWKYKCQGASCTKMKEWDHLYYIEGRRGGEAITPLFPSF